MCSDRLMLIMTARWGSRPGGGFEGSRHCHEIPPYPLLPSSLILRLLRSFILIRCRCLDRRRIRLLHIFSPVGLSHLALKTYIAFPWNHYTLSLLHISQKIFSTAVRTSSKN